MPCHWRKNVDMKQFTEWEWHLIVADNMDDAADWAYSRGDYICARAMRGGADWGRAIAKARIAAWQPGSKQDEKTRPDNKPTECEQLTLEEMQ